MKYFFLLLFFSKTVLLVPEPIKLTEEWTKITPEKPFTAIASGSEIRLRLTRDTEQLRKLRRKEEEYNKVGSFGDPFEDLEKFFPKNSIKGKIIWADGTKYNIGYCGPLISRNSNKKVVVELSLCGNLPVDIEFKSIEIMSENVIENVELYWQNMGKL